MSPVASARFLSCPVCVGVSLSSERKRGGLRKVSVAGMTMMVTKYASIVPSAEMSPKRRSISVSETMSEPRPTALVNEVRKQATAIVRSARAEASTESGTFTAASSSSQRVMRCTEFESSMMMIKVGRTLVRIVIGSPTIAITPTI